MTFPCVYVDAQRRATDDYGGREEWTRRAIRTVARRGYFSSDRSVADYCRDIWHVPRVRIASH